MCVGTLAWVQVLIFHFTKTKKSINTLLQHCETWSLQSDNKRVPGGKVGLRGDGGDWGGCNTAGPERPGWAGCGSRWVGSLLCAVLIRAVQKFHAGSSALQAEDLAASRTHVSDPRKGLKPLYSAELPCSALPRSCFLSPNWNKKGPWVGWWPTCLAETQLLIIQGK